MEYMWALASKLFVGLIIAKRGGEPRRRRVKSGVYKKFFLHTAQL